MEKEDEKEDVAANGYCHANTVSEVLQIRTPVTRAGSTQLFKSVFPSLLVSSYSSLVSPQKFVTSQVL